MFELGALIISSSLNGLLGFIVYTKNPRSATNKLFALLCVSFIAWATANYLSLHPIFLSQLTWIRLVLFCAAFLCLFANMTLSIFPQNGVIKLSRVRVLVIAYVLMVMLLSLTPAVFRSVVVKNGQPSPIPNFGIVLFIALVVGLLGQGLLSLIVRYRKASGLLKAQLGLVIFGLAGAFILIVSTNLFLVVVFHNSSLVPMGPAYTLIFSGTLYYAIVRRKLFDIGATTARLVAYVISLGMLGVIYGALIIGLSSILPAAGISLQRLLYVGLAMLTALFYAPMKRIVAKITNNILYQDIYNPQELFNSLNRVLVANMELDKLLTNALETISATFKTEFSTVVLTAAGSAHGRIVNVGVHKLPFGIEDLNALYNLMDVSGSLDSVVVTDLQENDAVSLVRFLRKRDIATLAVLLERTRTTDEALGYILMGPKKSGRLYDKKDVQVLEAIANEMVIAIQNAIRFEEIEKFNVTLQEEIASATSRLRHSNQKLQELDETKDDFISMASHQLRTPLTSVKGYLSMVLEGDAGKLNPTQTKMLQQAFSSSQRMVFLITDLLNVSRLKTGKFVIDSAPVDLSQVTQQEVSQLKETAEAKEVQLKYDKPASFPQLMLDEVKIRQVIMNFIDNSIYYTQAGGHIRVELADRPTTVELRVIDDGIGVPKNEQHHLFTKFYRAANARKARPDGTGLGLFMAKKVVLAQGGSIIFSSKEGQGSTFGFAFSKSVLKVPGGKPNGTTIANKQSHKYPVAT